MTRRRAALPRREPNGRHDRTLDRLVEARSPTEVRRLRDAALSGLRAPEWGSELGRLFLETKLTPTQYEAGRRFGVLIRQYEIALAAPGYPTASPGQNAPGRHREGQGEALRHQEAVHHYDEAIAALRASQADCVAIVELVCHRDATCGSGRSLLLLQAGLDTLATLWRIPL